MNILIAPNSMKGSISSFDFAGIVEKAFISCSDDFIIRKIPVADGGDNTGEVLRSTLNAKEIKLKVQDPLGRPVDSKYAISGETAIIEMADASGIKLLKVEELNPLKASSFGTGQLIAGAIEKGCSEIMLGIGGSATVDGGTGMIEALGFQLFGEENERLKGNGENLIKVRRVKKPESLINLNVAIKIICDVDNPLNGPEGAAYVFGPQKGATPDMVSDLDRGLANWSNIIEKDVGKKLAILKGAGAAGGIALPLIAWYNAEIVKGADYILSMLNFEEHVQWSDLIITGEGKLDSQTLNNKAPKAVADFAHRYNKPVVAIGGSVQKDASQAFTAIFSIINEPLELEKAMIEAPKLLYDLSFELAKLLWRLGKK